MKASSDLIADTKTTKAYESGQVTIYESEPTTTPFWSGSRRVERALASNFRAWEWKRTQARTSYLIQPQHPSRVGQTELDKEKRVLNRNNVKA